MKLPSEILVLKLFRHTYVTKEEKWLVLTGMNCNKSTLYEEAKKSLKEFKGSKSESSTIGSSIKIEPAFLAANEEALLAVGYTRARGNGQRFDREKGATRRRRRPDKRAVVVAGVGEFQRLDPRTNSKRWKVPTN